MILKIRDKGVKKEHIACYVKKQKEVFQEDAHCKVSIRARLKDNIHEEQFLRDSLPLSILGGRQLK
jgi:hypothetical protein